MNENVYRNPEPGEVERFLSYHATECKRVTLDRSGENLNFRPCPSCGHNKSKNMAAYINPEKGLWNCFACEARGNWYQFTKAFGDPLSDDDKYHEDYKPRVDWKEEWQTHFEEQDRTPVSSDKYPKLLDYCKSRGISEATLDAFRVTSQGENMVRFPIFAFHEKKPVIVNMKIVKINWDEEKNSDWFEKGGGRPTHLMIGNHLLFDDGVNKRVWIFEGQWDVLAAYEIGLRNVLSLPNGAKNVLPDMLKYVPADWEIVLAVDMDEQGDKCADKFFQMYGFERVSRCHMPHKDLNEWLKNEPELTPADVEKRISGMNVFVLPDTKYDDFFSSECQETGAKLITDTPFPTLSKFLNGGFFEAQTTGILAGSGSGKSTIVNQLALWAAQHGVKTGLISLEDPELKFKVQRLAKSFPNFKTLGQSNISITQLERRRTSHEEVIRQVGEFIKERKKFIIVDNLDYITAPHDSAKKAQTYGKIIELVEKYDIHVVMVWQPLKINPDKKVTSEDQKGFSSALQDSCNYINVNKVSNEPYGRVLHVEKRRSMLRVTDGLDDPDKRKTVIQFEPKYNSYFECNGEYFTNTSGSIRRKLELLKLPEIE